jgi:hypothetical protein
LTSGPSTSGEIAVLRQYKGTVLQTTLDTADEESLKRALGDDTPIN